MLKAVLFDLDGTLFDSFPLLLMGYRFAVREVLGLETSDADWEPLIGLPIHVQMGHFSPEKADELVRVYREFYAKHHDEMLALFPGAFEAVEELHRKGFVLAAVTSKKTSFARRGLEHLGLMPFFQGVVGEDETTRHKPEPEPVLYALEMLSIGPDEALMVGDAPYDLLSARAAGVRSAAVLWGAFSRERLEEAGADFFVDRIEEIVMLGERLRGRGGD